MLLRLASCVWLTVGLGLAGCAVAPERPVLVESPLPLLAGQELVVELERASLQGEAASADRVAPMRLPDGRTLDTRLVHMAEESVAASGWLAGATWRRSSAQVDRARSFLVVDMPPDALGQSVWFDGRRVPSFWILPSLRASSSDELPIAPPLRTDWAPAQRDAILKLIEAERRDPRLRWRARRALERLGIDDRAPLDDAVLEAWAAQWDARLEAAFQRLIEANPGVASRWLDVMTRWLVTPYGVLPMWPTDADTITDTILAMLRPDASDAAVLRAAESLISREPAWLAWVIDDAGGVVGGTIAVANLTGTRALLSARAVGGPWIAHGMVEPGAVQSIPAPSAQRNATQAYEVRLGGRTAILPIATDAIPMKPPGVAIGPFWYDWTCRGLIQGTAGSPAPASANWLAGLIQRDPRPNADSVATSGWAVYVEITRPPCELDRMDSQLEAIDSVQLFFGPTESPRAVVRVRCTGVASWSSTAQRTPQTVQVFTRQSSDRWAFTLPIDRAWLEPDGTILIGAKWVPAAGQRASWPRPLLPGQDVVGRVRMDPNGWSLPQASPPQRSSSPATTGP
ncbi:MAG: hypothetical protein RIB58_09525 [Phycisphaerales bacterium]